jgi:hypothetical protein
MPYGPAKFRSTAVKPYLTDKHLFNPSAELNPTSGLQPLELPEMSQEDLETT